MYKISSPAVYAHESVMENPVYRSRVEHVAGVLEGNQKTILFNAFRFGAEGNEQSRSIAAQLGKLGANPGITGSLLGQGAIIWAGYNQKGDASAHDKVCRPCWRIHLQKGCVQRCKYCTLGGLLISMVNIEEYCIHLQKIINEHPWQKTYLLDDDADPPCLEPELGVLGPFIEYFGTLKDRYLIIHTKTWNTEWLRDLKHSGNTILVWSLSGRTQASQIEPKAGTLEERIEAARIAQEAGDFSGASAVE